MVARHFKWTRRTILPKTFELDKPVLEPMLPFILDIDENVGSTVKKQVVVAVRLLTKSVLCAMFLRTASLLGGGF